MKTAVPAATVTFRRLNPDAPVGLRADACLPLRSRHSECNRCVEACPAGVLHRSEEFFFLDDGCLGCGRCAAVCPMGAIAVASFALRPTEIKAPRPLALDCWKVPAAASPMGSRRGPRAGSEALLASLVRPVTRLGASAASPPHGVRVPCLGGLSPGQWLGLVLAARGHGVELLDRGWCGACPANLGAAHPAAAALAVVHGWLKEARVPRQHWPWLVRAPLPATRAVTPDPRNETPVNRRNFFGALAHESVSLANAALDAPRAQERHRKSSAGTRREVARSRRRKVPGAHAPVASPERERVLVFLAALAARHGGDVPVSLYPAIAINADCHHHCLCAALCPTGALRLYTDNDSVGIAYDAARCIACGQCESACPEHALHLQPAVPGTDAVVALTRHATRACATCGETFAANGRETRCPPCRKSRDFARAGFVTLYRDAGKRGARDKH